MISVILTTHQGRKDLCKRAIESVLAQTYKDFELIVVDDGSKDGTDKMVESFKDDRIKYIKRSKSFGNDTRPKNRGIKESRGEFIAFLDSDNTFRLDHLQALVRGMEGYDVAYGDRWVRGKENRAGVGVNQPFSPAKLLEKNYIDTSDVLIKREALYYVGGWDERYGKYVDWNLWLRLAKAGMRFNHIPLIITDYYQLENAKSATKLTKNEQEYIKLYGKPCPNIPDWDPWELEIRLPYLGEVKPPKVAVFTLTYDRLEYTKASFKSIHDTAGYAFDHFVIDNGSKDGTDEFLTKEANIVHYTLNGVNKGISIASNQALDVIGDKYDIVVKIDNDAILITEGWLKKMVDIWERNHLLAMSPYPQGLKDNPGGATRLGYGEIGGELVGMTRHLGGLVHFVSRKAYENFRWDEDQPLHGVQDLELSQHLINNGYQMCYLENYYVEHTDGTEGQHEKYPQYFERRKIEKQKKYAD
jgi:glycosyltransferase involved in cell wall biosynthesis